MRNAIVSKGLLVSICMIFMMTAHADTTLENLSGKWLGSISVSGANLRLVFHVEGESGNYRATMDSIDQGISDIPVNSVTTNTEEVIFDVEIIGGSFNGKFTTPDTMTGKWSQSGMTFPMTLQQINTPPKLNRPQEPEPPFPYKTKDITFTNEKDGIKLSGTLTIPEGEGPFPAVVLISGSGPQDRNETIMGHKPFLVIADYLNRHGIAVLRYDDRGAFQSEGDFMTATFNDFVSDVASAVKYLQNLDDVRKDQIGLVGHSEGGIVAPVVEVITGDIAFLVLLAAPGLPGHIIVKEQTRAIQNAMGLPEDITESNVNMLRRAHVIIANTRNFDRRKNELDKLFQTFTSSLTKEQKTATCMTDKAIASKVALMASSAFRYFMMHNPADTLKLVDVPVLAIIGERDLQVRPETNMQAIETALKEGGNTHVTTHVFPGLNHFFQESKTGSPLEYASIEQTISSQVLTVILEWILLQTEHV